MPIVLRLDIDKPYGRSNLSSKLLSKVKENYLFPSLDALGYLRDLAAFLVLLNEKKIRAMSYHRICTAPNPAVTELLRNGGHLFGLHAEDTRSIETVRAELNWL